MKEEMTIAELLDEETEVTDEELNEENEFEDLEFEDSEFGNLSYEPSRTVTEIAQPIETFVEVGAKELANGKLTPFCKFSIKRNITEKTDEFEVIDDDFETLIERVKETMSRFQEE